MAKETTSERVVVGKDDARFAEEDGGKVDNWIQILLGVTINEKFLAVAICTAASSGQAGSLPALWKRIYLDWTHNLEIGPSARIVEMSLE